VGALKFHPQNYGASIGGRATFEIFGWQ